VPNVDPYPYISHPINLIKKGLKKSITLLVEMKMKIVRCLNCGGLIRKRKRYNEFCGIQCKEKFDIKIKPRKTEIDTYGYIFKITNRLINKIYIKQIRRTNIHSEGLRNSTNEHGIEIEVIDSAKDKKELEKKKKYWSDFYNTN